MWQTTRQRVSAVCVTAVVLGACGGGTITSPATLAKTNPLFGRPQVGVLFLHRGAASAGFTITALSPPHHTYEVRITAPARVNVAVRIHTWYGVELGVEDSTHDAQWCKVTGAQATCSLLFPELEAQRPGPWRVIASKRVGPAAVVRISVTFWGRNGPE